MGGDPVTEVSDAPERPPLPEPPRGLRRVREALLGPPLSAPEPVFDEQWQAMEERPAEPGALKVLVLSHMFPFPRRMGSGPFVHEQCAALARHRGMEVRVISPQPWFSLALHPVNCLRLERWYHRRHRAAHWWSLDGVAAAFPPYRIFRAHWLDGWAYQASVLRLVRRVRRRFAFDLIHAHTGYLDGGAGLAAAERYGVPLVITEHTSPFSGLMKNPVIRRRTLAALAGADRVIAVSRAQARDVGRCLPRDARQKIEVIPNGIDLELFRLSPKRRENVQGPRLLFAGGSEPRKGAVDLLQALAILRRDLPEARLTITESAVEIPDEAAALRRAIARWGQAEAVAVLPHQPRPAMARLMADSDIYVLASHAESFGCVLIEAMASGRPVAATRCGGPEDIVTDPALGRLVPAGRPAEMAEAIAAIYHGEGLGPPEAMREHARRNYSYQEVARRLDGLYRRVLDEAAERQGRAG